MSSTTNNSNNIDWLNNPTITQILQMVIGFYDPDTDVFDEFGVDLDKARELIEAKLKEAEIDARIDELRACLSNVPMPPLSYEQVENRIAELKALKVSKAEREQK